MRRAHNEHFRFGSADFANGYDIGAAEMFRQSPTSLFLGFFEGKPLWYDGAGGLLLVGGARSGKRRDVLAYNLCTGIYSKGSLLVLDMKDELAAISQNQTADQKYAAYWNPAALLQSYFALRDIQSSRDISDMLGAQTLEFNDPLHQSRAKLARQQVFQSLMHGDDPFTAGMMLAQYKFEAGHRTKQRRPLQTPDEVMNANMGEQFIFTDDVAKPILANREPYYEQRFMAGRFHPNPLTTRRWIA